MTKTIGASPVEYKIYRPKRGSIELSMPIGDGWRLYVYQHSKLGRTWYEAKMAKPRFPAVWLDFVTGADAWFAHPSITSESVLLEKLEDWLYNRFDPLRLTLFMADLRDVWAYALSGVKPNPPVTHCLVPDLTVRFLARAKGPAGS